MKPVKGTVDYYPEEEAIKQSIFSKLSETAARYGFQKIEPPVVESFDLISKKQGEEIRSQIFTMEKKGKEDLALIAEFTPSFARMFIQKQKNLSKPVKWYTIGKTWRYERPQKGREREFYQFNVEIYGSSSPIADAELISLAIESLKALGVKESDLDVRVNDRELLRSEVLKYTKEVEQVTIIVDKKEKVSPSEFKDMLKKYIPNPNPLLKFLNTTKPDGKLKEVLSLLPYKCVRYDPSTVRGFLYYTGTVFEIFDKNGNLRSLCGGGRYDALIKLYGGEDTPALGFGMGYSTLSLFLEEKNLLPLPQTSSEVFIGWIENEKEAAKLANKLRAYTSVSLNLVERNLANQLKNANQLGVKKVIIIGPEEVKSKKAKVKDMETGKEKLVTFSDISSGKI